VNEQEILDHGIKIYALLWNAFVQVLTSQKNHAPKVKRALGKIGAMKIGVKNDMETADKLLRETFVYDAKRPKDVAPYGFSPLLGLCLAHRGMCSALDVCNLMEQGTFAGHLFEFNCAVIEFCNDVQERLPSSKKSLRDAVSMIYHDAPVLPIITPNRLFKHKKRVDQDSSYDDAFRVAMSRCVVQTWRFGEIHQCVVNIGDVRVGLAPCGDVDSALEKGVVWAETFEKNGPPDMPTVFEDCFKNWPTIYQTRIDVINHIFFVIGNGYEWVDGSIICTSPEDATSPFQNHRELVRAKRLARLKASAAAGDKRAIETMQIMGKLFEEPTPGPHPDGPPPYSFYPVCDFSKICHVPDNVTDSWLRVAYGAAVLLRDHSGAVERGIAGVVYKPNDDDRKRQAANAKIGAEIVKELVKRFGERLRAMRAIGLVESGQALVEASS
jgi:hypothetical protein